MSQGLDSARARGYGRSSLKKVKKVYKSIFQFFTGHTNFEIIVAALRYSIK
jgi:hypothetical protein